MTCVAPHVTPSFKNPAVMVSMGEVNVHQSSFAHFLKTSSAVKLIF